MVVRFRSRRRRLSRAAEAAHRNDPVHKDSIAFMEILNQRPDLRRRYEEAKDRAHAIDPVNAEIYKREKEAVIRQIHEQVD